MDVSKFQFLRALLWMLVFVTSLLLFETTSETLTSMEQSHLLTPNVIQTYLKEGLPTFFPTAEHTVMSQKRRKTTPLNLEKKEEEEEEEEEEEKEEEEEERALTKNIDMEVRFVGVTFPHGPCPEERDRSDDDDNWRIVYLAKVYIPDKKLGTDDDINKWDTYTCFIDETDDDDNNVIPLDSYPLLLNDYWRFVFRIFGVAPFIHANKNEIAHSNKLTGKTFDPVLLHNSFQGHASSLDLYMTAFNKNGQNRPFSCAHDSADQQAYQSTISIDYQIASAGIWHYIDTNVVGTDSWSTKGCHYTFRFRYKYVVRTEPVLHTIWPTGFDPPPIIFDDTESFEEKEISKEKLQESIFLFGENVLADGISGVTDYICRVSYIEDAQSGGSYFGASNQDNLNLQGANIKLLMELPGIAVRDLGARLDSLEVGGDFIQRDYLTYYGGPSAFVSGLYETAVECKGFLDALKAKENDLNNPKYYKVGRFYLIELGWKYGGTGNTLYSAQAKTILIHGPFDAAQTTVEFATDTATIFQPNSLVITSKWNLRQANRQDSMKDITQSGGDLRRDGTDIFLVEWQNGPGVNPEFGINTGTLINNWDGTYTLPFVIDFVGDYCVKVYYVDPRNFTIQEIGGTKDRTVDSAKETEMVSVSNGAGLYQIGCTGKSIKVSGLSVGRVPDVNNTSTSINWADQITREDLSYYDTDLVKAIANNRGSADKEDVLGPIFKRWGGGWFQQRETLSLMIEWPPLNTAEVIASWDSIESKRYTGENHTTLRSASVHQILRQGIGRDDFCDIQIDPWGNQRLMYNLYPWEQVAQFDAGTTVRSIKTVDVRNDACTVGIEVYLDMLINPEEENEGFVPEYSIFLRHVESDLKVELSAQDFNPILDGNFIPRPVPDCCQNTWCDPDLSTSKYNDRWIFVEYCPDVLIECINQTSGDWDPLCPVPDGCDTGGGETQCLVDYCIASGEDQCIGQFNETTNTDWDMFICNPAPDYVYVRNSSQCSNWGGLNTFLFTNEEEERYNWRDLGKANCSFDISCDNGNTFETCNTLSIDCSDFIKPDDKKRKEKFIYSVENKKYNSNLRMGSGNDCYSFPPTVNSSVSEPTRLCFNTDNTDALHGLGRFLNKPIAGEWRLILESANGNLGTLIDWQLAFELQNCNMLDDIEIIQCAMGEGTESFQMGTDVTLTCPEGTLITEIKESFYGYPSGDCSSGYVPSDFCDLRGEMVIDVVERTCLFKDSCVLSSDPNNWVSSHQNIDTWLCDPVRCNVTTFEMCPAELPYLKIRARCEVSSSEYTVEEIPSLNVNETLISTFPPPLLVQSASGLFDGFTQTTTYRIDAKEEVFTAFSREGECLNIVIKSTQSDGVNLSTDHYTYQWCSVLEGNVTMNITVFDQITVETGDFDGDRYSEVALGYVDQRGNLQILMWDLHAADETLWNKENRWIDTIGMTWTFENSVHFRFNPNQKEEISIYDSEIFKNITKGAENIVLRSKGFGFDIATGDLDFDLADESVVVWLHDTKVYIQVFRFQYFEDADGEWEETLVGQVFSEESDTGFFELQEFNNPHAVAVEVGNFEGLGYQDICVIISDEDGLWLEIINVDELRDFALSSQGRTKIRDTDPLHTKFNFHNVKASSGDLNSDGKDELVFGSSNSNYLKINVWSVGGTLSNGTPCIQLACMMPMSTTQIRVGPNFNESARIRRPAEFHLHIGNMDNTRAEEIVVVAEYNHANLNLANLLQEPATRVLVTSFSTTETLFTLIEQGQHCHVGPGYAVPPDVENTDRRLDPNYNEYIQNRYIVNNIGATVGNLYGFGLRVGIPEYIKTEGIPRVLAVVNAPPTHIDTDLGGGTLIVNSGTISGTSGSYTFAGMVDGITGAWEFSKEGGSATTSISGDFVTWKLFAFEGSWDVETQKVASDSILDGTSNNINIAIHKTLRASQDDVVMFSSTNMDIWKYPIIDQDGTVVGTLDIEWPSSCGDDCIQVSNGRDLRWFVPSHEVFNVLSYSTRAPSDFTPSGRIMVGDRVLMGVDGHEQWIDQQSATSQGKTTKNTTSYQDQDHLKLGAGSQLSFATNLEPLGIGASLEIPVSVSGGSDTTSNTANDDVNTDNKQATFSKSASIHMNLEPIDPSYAYWVQPFLYYVRPSNNRPEYIVVDYTAEPAFEPGQFNWWYHTYNKPDPAFNRPYGFSKLHRSLTLRTKEFRVMPQPPVKGEPVTIEWVIHNYSTREARSVRVYFWKGDPDNCIDFYCFDTSKIGATEIAAIPKQGSVKVFSTHLFDGIQNIYATIDSDDMIDEMHEDNNKAYNYIWTTFTPDPLTDGEYGSFTFTISDIYLSMDEMDNQFGGFIPIIDETTNTISSYDIKVKVTGNTFTTANIPLLFYNGNPQDPKIGGDAELFAIEVISILENNTSIFVTARWDVRDLEGNQEIHVFVVHEGFDATPYNTLDELVLKKKIGCYYKYDACGVCGGDDTSCLGCDGFVNSNITYDRCGVCGGDGTSCCIFIPTQHIIRIQDNVALPQLVEIVVGDTIVFENLDQDKYHNILTMVAPNLVIEVLEDPNYGIGVDTTLLEEKLNQLPLPRPSGGSNPDTSSTSTKSSYYLGENNKFTTKLEDTMGGIRTSYNPNTPRSNNALIGPPLYTSDTLYDYFSHIVHQDLTNDQLSMRSTSPKERKALFQRRAFFMNQRMSSTSGKKESQKKSKTPPPLPPRPKNLLSRIPKISYPALQALNRQKKDVTRAITDLHGYITKRDAQLADQRQKDKEAAKKEADAEKKKTKKTIGAVGDIGGISGLTGGVSGIGGSPISTGSGYFGGGSTGRLLGGFNLNALIKQPPNEAEESTLPPGKGGLAIQFPIAGSFHWADTLSDVIQGTILVRYSPYQEDQCGVCDGNGLSCVDCVDVLFGSAFIDNCDICSNGTTNHTANSDVDCNGVCFGTSKTDDCGTCVLGSTGKEWNYFMDCDNICFGNSTFECGVCWNPFDSNATTPYDCMGVCNGTSYLDNCGTCVMGSSGRGAFYSYDCYGDCFGFAEYDHCGECRGGNTKTLPIPDDIACPGEIPCNETADGPLFFDCSGECGGNTYYDKRNGFCRYSNHSYVGDSGNKRKEIPTYFDCNNDPDGFAAIDDCGECYGGTTRKEKNYLMDCSGVCDGNATLDNCGICSGGIMGIIPNSDTDCADVCFGNAIIDDCGVCTGGLTGVDINAYKDCAGQCFGNHQPEDLACNCPPGSLDECFVCFGDNTVCAGCDGIPWSGKQYDFCGVCGGNYTQCCFYPGEATTIRFDEEGVHPKLIHIVTGGTIRLENRLDWSEEEQVIVLHHVNAIIEPFEIIVGSVALGQALEFTIKQPGHFIWNSDKYPIFQGSIMVTFNTNTTDACGICGGDGSKCCEGSDSCGRSGGCVLPNSDESENRRLEATVIMINEHHRVSPSVVDLSTGSWVRFENYDTVEHLLSFYGPSHVTPLRLQPLSTSEWQFHTAGTYHWKDNEQSLIQGYVYVFCDSESSDSMQNWEIFAIGAGIVLLLSLFFLGIIAISLVAFYTIIRWFRTPDLVESIEMKAIKPSTRLPTHKEKMEIQEDVTFDRSDEW